MESSFLIVWLFLAFAIIVILILACSGLYTRKGTAKFLRRHAKFMTEVQNDIISDNQDILKDTANKKAEIHKDAVKTIVHSAKEGLSSSSNFITIYCKYCGSQIDEDSVFCKRCGKQLK